MMELPAGEKTVDVLIQQIADVPIEHGVTRMNDVEGEDFRNTRKSEVYLPI